MSIYVLSFTITLLMTIAQAILCASFLSAKTSNKKITLYFSIFIIVLFMLINIKDLGQFPIKQIVCTVLLTVFLHLTFQGSIAIKLLCAILSYAVLYTIDVVMNFTFAFILNSTYQDLSKSITAFIIITFTSCFVQFIVAFIIYRIRKHQQKLEQLSIASWITMAALPVFSLTAIIIMLQITMQINEINLLFVVTALGMFIANIGVMLLITKVENDEKIKKDNSLLQIQLNQQMEIANALIHSHSAQRKLTHDFKHHLNTVNALLLNKAYEKAVTYIGDITNKVSGELVVNSNNPFVDAVLNQKYSLAKSKGILTEISLNELSSFPLNGEETVILLSNLLDNAIEACEKVESKKLIRIKITYNKYETLISIGNTVNSNEITKLQGNTTTKSNSLMHGFGLKNVMSILQKYNTFPSIECVDEWYQLSILITN